MYLFDWIMLFTFHYLRNVSKNMHLILVPNHNDKLFKYIYIYIYIYICVCVQYISYEKICVSSYSYSVICE